MGMAYHSLRAGTWTTRHGKRVVVTPLYITGKDLYDLEYLDADGAVVEYRHALDESVVNDLKNLQRWERRG